MNLDEFEERMRGVPRREVPTAWREQLLGPLRHQGTAPAIAWWRQWLWPHPAAWASLAVIWLAIFALHFAAAPEPVAPFAALTKPAPEMLQAFEDRIRLMAELSPESPQRETEPSPADRPRSCTVTEEVAV
jgi:hypothetical protein